MAFLKSRDKSAQNRDIFVKKYWILKFDRIWPNLTWSWLFLGSNFKMSVTPNYLSQIIHKTFVARHLNNILIWWPYLTWPWPWPLLSIRPILLCYFFNRFVSFLAEFGSAAAISSVSVADKAKSDGFGLWPDLNLTCKLLRFFNLLTKYSSRAFVCRLAHLAMGKRSWVRQGRGSEFAPPPAGRVRPNTTAERRL